MMLRCIVALAFLSAAVSQPMQLTETMYEGGSCTADAKASATLPMGTCVAVSMAYREAWGLDAMTHMVVFHLDNSLEQCFASSQLLCETAMRDVVTSYIASFAWNSDLPGVATYPNTTSAVCASYKATAAELVGTCWAADDDVWQCPLAGCRIEYALAEAPPPASPPTLITESLYRNDCDGMPVVTFTTASGECEATTSEYREAWSDYHPDECNWKRPDETGEHKCSAGEPSDSPRGAYSGFRKDAVSGVVTWCWGSTKVACDSGFAGAPYGMDDIRLAGRHTSGERHYLDTATQICGDYRVKPNGAYASQIIDVCWAEDPADIGRTGTCRGPAPSPERGARTAATERSRRTRSRRPRPRRRRRPSQRRRPRRRRLTARPRT